MTEFLMGFLLGVAIVALPFARQIVHPPHIDKEDNNFYTTNIKSNFMRTYE
jgi:hypothetical protein